MDKLKLYGFNNLTKTLSFNIYDICYTRSEEERNSYIEYIDDQYNSDRLTHLLLDVAKIIDANVLNIAKQDYEPQGASVTMMISEEEVDPNLVDPSCNSGNLLSKDSVVGHLDKSHLTVHTYPESHPVHNISTFRVDIDVSTCGMISPNKALNYLINSFDSDVIVMDYRVRGFTRDTNGDKVFIDHEINTIHDFIDEEILNKYTVIDINLEHSNIFHTKMMLKQFCLDNYLFNVSSEDLEEDEKERIQAEINRETAEIFYGMNIPKML